MLLLYCNNNIRIRSWCVISLIFLSRNLIIYNVELRILPRYFFDKQTFLIRQIPCQAYMLAVTAMLQMHAGVKKYVNAKARR